jgi:vacuolar-type H+-ATPase subunit I/STV1
MRNIFSAVCGLLIFLLNGLFVNHLFAVTGIDENCNSMYLQNPPFESMPWLTTAFMGIAGVTLAFLLGVIFERVVLHKKWKEIFGRLAYILFGFTEIKEKLVKYKLSFGMKDVVSRVLNKK